MSNITRPGRKEMQPHRSLSQHHNTACIKARTFSRQIIRSLRLAACGFSVEGYAARSTGSSKPFCSAYLGQPFYTPDGFVIL
jgi:hypothetical protein